jgi:hypothetical protein
LDAPACHAVVHLHCLCSTVPVEGQVASGQLVIRMVELHNNLALFQMEHLLGHIFVCWLGCIACKLLSDLDDR